MRAGAKGLGGGQLALDLFHPGMITGAGHFKPADTGVMAHLLVEIDRILGGPDREIVVAGRVAEIRGMGRGADIGRDAGLVDADDIVPAAFDQMMGDRGADDAAETDDDDFSLGGKFCHGETPESDPTLMVANDFVVSIYDMDHPPSVQRIFPVGAARAETLAVRPQPAVAPSSMATVRAADLPAQMAPST